MTAPDFSFLTHVGNIRENNEDAYYFPQNIAEEVLQTNGYLFAVADGMGGHRGGKEASNLICRALAEFYKATRPHDEPWEAWARSEIEKLLERIAHYVYGCRYIEEDRYAEMGSTLTGVLVRDNTALVFNIGDSRVYHLSGARGLYQVSEDHSKVRSLVEQGLITAEGAENHPDANIVTRSLGMSPFEDNGKPDLKIIQFLPGEKLLLCSDGLSDVVAKEKIAEILLDSGRFIEEAAQQLVHETLKTGAPDNVTVGLIHLQVAQEKTVKAETPAEFDELSNTDNSAVAQDEKETSPTSNQLSI